MSEKLSATLAPTRVTPSMKRAVDEVTDRLGLTEADLVRLSVRFYLGSDGGVCRECGGMGDDVTGLPIDSTSGDVAPPDGGQ